MPRHSRLHQRPSGCAVATTLCAVMLAAITSQSARAAIMGGEGNQPIADPGWPQGAAVIFNHPSRIAWWEGPPFGGGQWHAECRGDSQALSGILADFARLDLKAQTSDSA